MYYQNYEDYMKRVLGRNYVPEDMNNQSQFYPYNYYVPTYTKPYPESAEVNSQTNNMPEYRNGTVNPMSNMSKMNNAQAKNADNNTNIIKLKRMYPDIYNILTPMVEKIVNENQNKEITEELIETMTKEIYENVEEDMSVKQVSTNASVSDNKTRNMTTITQTSNISNIKQPPRRPKNTTLRDLIRILIINRFLENILGNRALTPFERQNIRPQFSSEMSNKPVASLERTDTRPPMMHGPMPRMSYPVMNYFNTPYPEDEYLG